MAALTLVRGAHLQIEGEELAGSMPERRWSVVTCKAPNVPAIAGKAVEVMPLRTRLSIGHSIFWVPDDVF